MPRPFRTIMLAGLGALLFACSPLPTDLTPALTQREQQVCDADIKGGNIAECMTPYNIQSDQINPNSAARAQGVTAAWCAQYDFAERDKANTWISHPDTVLVTELQDGTFKTAPIDKPPADGCASFTMP